MRIWDQRLIKSLPYNPGTSLNQLGGQRRENAAMRGLGWEKKHSTVQYALDDEFEKLIAYDMLIIDEILRRNPNANIDKNWLDYNYRGKRQNECKLINIDINKVNLYYNDALHGKMIYDYRDDKYLQECIENLKLKGIEL